LANDIALTKARQAKLMDAILTTPVADIEKNPDLMEFAMRGGAAQFSNNCAPCHGRGAQGLKGYPNLNDDDWLWGGSTEQIERTILYGIRSDNTQGHDMAMPRFGIDQMLTSQQISDTADYVLSLSQPVGEATAVERGKTIFAEQCTGCHGEDAKGSIEMGAPNLTDGIWLYGGDKTDIRETIRTGRGGVMPAWDGKLDAATVKILAIYVHSLGGGK
jgi:cytochrome c oxidase cbb3-type subunit 3